MSMLKDLFKDQALVDERTPSFTFEIPGVEGTWGFFPPVLQTWLLFIYVSHSLGSNRNRSALGLTSNSFDSSWSSKQGSRFRLASSSTNLL